MLAWVNRVKIIRGPQSHGLDLALFKRKKFFANKILSKVIINKSCSEQFYGAEFQNWDGFGPVLITAQPKLL